MERMTYRLEDRYGNYICMGTPKKLEVVLSRLAAYEDTGLEPEEIELLAKQRDLYVDACGELPLKRIRELAQADREGKIPKYTIGDTIYDRFGNAWEVTAVERRLLAGEPKWIYRCGHIGTDDYFALWEFEVLTCEEAEAARREQDG